MLKLPVLFTFFTSAVCIAECNTENTNIYQCVSEIGIYKNPGSAEYIGGKVCLAFDSTDSSRFISGFFTDKNSNCIYEFNRLGIFFKGSKIGNGYNSFSLASLSSDHFSINVYDENNIPVSGGYLFSIDRKQMEFLEPFAP